jgi:tetratricopeptide (TPR) repeat protein
MKKTLIMMLLALSLCSYAQDAARFKDKYERQVRSVGADGVGVEYILDKWEEAFPDDPDMLEGRYSYYFAKSRSEEVQKVDAAKYLGSKPVLTLKDSLGRNVNYFTVPVFNDSLFRMSQKYIDRAIETAPDVLMYRFDKISALAAYEKDSPDMAATAMLDLIDYDAKAHPKWLFEGGEVSREDFEAAVQEYCYLFYKTGSANSYESFRILSERMLKANPKSTLFLNNLGAYWQVVKRDDKKASKYYRKVLKLNPGDGTATANLAIIEKNKQKKK